VKFEILDGVEIVEGLGLFLRRFDVLVIADLHIGYEAALEKQGITLPKSQYPKIKKTVEEMIRIVRPKVLIVNGDLKHEFGEATRQEWKETLDFIDFIQSMGIELIVVRGNHDNFLIPILKKKGVEFKDPSYTLGEFLFIHGHKQLNLESFKQTIKTIVMAHEHPAIGVRDELGVRRRFKCFLVGKVYDKNLIVMPALSPLMPGVEINNVEKDELLSPLLRVADIEEFVAIVYEGGEYFEIPLKEIR